MSVKSTYFSLLAALILAVNTSCGELDDPENLGAPLMTIHANITSIEEGIDTSALRVALIWGVGTTERRVVAQDVKIEATSLTRFDLEVFEPPPQEMMFEPSAMDALDLLEGMGNQPIILGGPYAVARLVVYEDRNDNGEIDFLGKGEKETIDRVVGPQPSYLVYYLEEDEKVTDQYSHGPYHFKQGFNLEVWDIAEGEAPRTLVDLDETVDLDLAVDLDLQQEICEQQPSMEFTTAEVGEIPVEEVSQDDWFRVICEGDDVTVWVHGEIELQLVDDTICSDRVYVAPRGTVAGIDSMDDLPEGWECYED